MMESIERALLCEVACVKWRQEAGLCLQFGGSREHTQTEDALARLVKKGLLQWFGPSHQPLRYKITRKGLQTIEQKKSRVESIERELREASWSLELGTLSPNTQYLVSEVAWREFKVWCRRPCSTCFNYLKSEGLLGDLASYSIEAAKALNL